MESKEYRYVETQFAEHKIYTFLVSVGIASSVADRLML